MRYGHVAVTLRVVNSSGALFPAAMDDDDYSDLTGLDSDDYESKPNKKGTKSKVGAHTVFRTKNALKPSRATTYTA